MLRRTWFLLLIVGLPVAVICAQQSQKSGQEGPALLATGTTAQSAHTFDITSAEKAQNNPIRFTDVSVARGKDLYQAQCAMCHGEKANGKSELVTEMKIAPPDFTNPSVLGKRTDGELFAIIGKGSELMPGEGHRLTTRQTWDLVNFLRAAEGKTPAVATAEEREKAQEAQTVVDSHQGFLAR
jgi:mono/diheme cytochrome c family protein